HTGIHGSIAPERSGEEPSDGCRARFRYCRALRPSLATLYECRSSGRRHAQLRAWTRAAARADQLRPEARRLDFHSVYDYTTFRRPAVVLSSLSRHLVVVSLRRTRFLDFARNDGRGRLAMTVGAGPESRRGGRGWR